MNSGIGRSGSFICDQVDGSLHAMTKGFGKERLHRTLTSGSWTAWEVERSRLPSGTRDQKEGEVQVKAAFRRPAA